MVHGLVGGKDMMNFWCFCAIASMWIGTGWVAAETDETPAMLIPVLGTLLVLMFAIG